MSSDALVQAGEPAPGDLGLGSDLPRSGGARLSVWVLRRIALSLLTLLGVSIIVFLATQTLPGDPAREILGHVTPAQVAAFNKLHGLDKPLLTQYVDWLKNTVTGSFGSSIATHEAVTHLIGRRGLNTLALVLLSALISIPLSLLIGTISAVRRDRPVDHGIQTVLLTLTAMPEFVIALLLLVLFATTVFTWLPAVAVIGPGETAFQNPEMLVLPVAALVLAVVPYVARLQRATMIDVLESEYVHMARLKGLREGTIIRRHAMRNSLVAAIQGSSLTLIYLTGGVVTIEFLFAYPGLGSALTSAVQTRDLPVIQAIVLVFAAAYVLINLCADLLTVYVTPKLRTQFR
ncbi:MAG: ABC transporter permease [Actinobacteria bacterium]|nr:ABC transporter permease [Actinomycetota bacterium]